MPEIRCNQCGQSILLGESFVRTGHDGDGKMIVEHAEHGIPPGERSRILTEGRVMAIETWRKAEV